MQKTIIFDVDGTLIDGTEGIIEAVKYTIKTHRLRELDEKQLVSFVGPPIQDSLKYFYGMDDIQAQECANTFRKKYSEEDVYKARVYDGIYELLDYLKSKGCKLGVATYKREDYAISLMKYFGFDKYFDAICGADNENKLKKLDIMENCINILCDTRENVIMIGDSNHDAGASKKLGVKFIGVTYGFGFKTEQEFEPYKNILLGVAKTPIQIKDFLNV